MDRRRSLLFSVILLNVGCIAGCGKSKLIPNLTRNILMQAPTNDEIALLSDIKIRRTVAKNQPLVIRNRVFDDHFRLQGFTLEDTEFVNCDFFSSIMLDGLLVNVRFTNCLFVANRWTDGAWTNVQFKDCAWRGPFNMGPVMGEGKLRFEDCEFAGSTFEELGYGGKAEYFGSIGGTMGDVVYQNCKFERVYINGGVSLRILKCKFEEVVVTAQNNSKILLEDVDGKELVEIGTFLGVFAKVHIRQCNFDSTVTLRGAKIELGLFEDLVATLDLALVKATRIELRRVSFKGEAKPEVGLMYGLIAETAKIGSMVIEDCTFVENGGALNLQGDEDQRAIAARKQVIRDLENIYATVIGNLVIRNTPVNNGRFDYVEAKEVLFENLAVAGANFSHCKIDRLLLRDVRLSGKIELAEADIRQKIIERVVDTSDWNVARQGVADRRS